MGLMEIALLAVLVVALAAGGYMLFMRHQTTLAHDAAEATLKEMLGDPKYSERSFDVLKLSVDAYDEEETRTMLNDIGAEMVEGDGGRELWTLPADASTEGAMPSA